MGVEGEDLGPCLYYIRSEGRLCRVSWVYSLLAVLKHRSRERGMGREEQAHSVSYLGYPGFSERGTFMGGEGLVPFLFVFLVAVSCS